MLRSIALFAGIGLMLAPAGARAFDPADVVDAELLSGWRMENGHHMAALSLRLEPGWKTYWRAPGDAGIPPRFDWDDSGNVASVAVHWPVPEVFVVNGLASVGYTGDVVMPIEVRPLRSAEAATLGGTIDIGVCEEICIPVSLSIRADLPVTGADVGTDVIRLALADRPLTAQEAGVGDVTCQTKPIPDGVRVTVSVQMPPLSANEAAVIEFSDPSVWISEAVTRREGTQLIASAEMVPANAAPFAVSRQDLRFTVLGDGRAVDIRGCTGG